MHAIVLDTETTARENGEVLELAYAEVQLHEHALSYTTPVCRLFSPKGDVEYGALATHHILPSEYADYDNYDPAQHAPKAEYYIGHNIDFDWKVMGQPAVKRICTLALARKYMSECDSHSQTALMYFITPQDEWASLRTRLRRAHSAEADIVFCVHILREIVALTSAKTFDELYTLSEDARVPRKMTFGKHKGEPIWMVDHGYRAWYRKQPDPDPYLLEAFTRYPYGKEPQE